MASGPRVARVPVRYVGRTSLAASETYDRAGLDTTNKQYKVPPLIHTKHLPWQHDSIAHHPSTDTGDSHREFAQWAVPSMPQRWLYGLSHQPAYVTPKEKEKENLWKFNA